MIVKYTKTYEYTVNENEHALFIKALQYISKHEANCIFGDAMRELLKDVICSSGK